MSPASTDTIANSLPYRIDYSPDAVDHLQRLPVRDQRNVVDGVDEQLAHQPAVETRNRKPMRPNPIAPWELRIGQLRVYYEVKEEPDLVVTVLAVGVKERNVVRIGGEEVNL
jgi:mRNA-degrading endonuclease RelE of RelBE toxin-antitoxin system